MIVRNESSYPTAEVEALVRFGVDGYDTHDLAVLVVDHDRAYKGWAYGFMPKHFGMTGRYAIKLMVGRPNQFPCDNLVKSLRWLPWGTTREDAVRQAKKNDATIGVAWSRCGTSSRFFYYYLHPYGGIRSPHITYLCWQEGLVGLAAHEVRHIHQYRHNLKRSEVDCERAANKRLEELRRTATNGATLVAATGA